MPGPGRLRPPAAGGPGGPGFRGSRAGFRGRPGPGFEGFHFEGGDLGDLFGNLFGGGRRASTGPEPGEDLRGQIEVPFRDAVLGGTASLALRREKPCPTCGGTGRVGKTVCGTCRGEGVVAESERVRIKIPEGTLDGGTIRVPGKGGPALRGGPPGDLYVAGARDAAPVLRAAGQRHPGRRFRSRSRRRTPAPRSTCPRSMAPCARRSRRHAEPAAVPPARQGRARIRAPAPSGDHLYSVARHGAEDADARPVWTRRRFWIRSTRRTSGRSCQRDFRRFARSPPGSPPRALRLDLRPDGRDLALLVDQVRHAVRAHVLAAVHLLLSPRRRRRSRSSFRGRREA